jgi:hypothetical protein
MAEALTWEVVFDDAPRAWTWRAVVPGGWLYRHRSVPFERPKEAPRAGVVFVEKELVPIACETMTFVPDPAKK